MRAKKLRKLRERQADELDRLPPKLVDTLRQYVATWYLPELEPREIALAEAELRTTADGLSPDFGGLQEARVRLLMHRFPVSSVSMEANRSSPPESLEHFLVPEADFRRYSQTEQTPLGQLDADSKDFIALVLLADRVRRLGESDDA
jgi:hypothetical protein